MIAWLRAQADKGARIMGICAGAKVVAAAGLLDGKHATTHWYYLGEMLELSPTVRYVPDRRMVADDGVATTTGISASMPMMLTLIEAIAGRKKAEEVAAVLGMTTWDARHASKAFRLTRPFAMTVLGNRLAFWNREEIEVRIDNGVDEVSLALVADAWSRSYRSSARTLAASRKTVISANGIRILPDIDAAAVRQGHRIDIAADIPPAGMLELTLQAIAERYDAATAHVVAMQLEYPWRGGGT